MNENNENEAQRWIVEMFLLAVTTGIFAAFDIKSPESLILSFQSNAMNVSQFHMNIIKQEM